MKVKKITLKQVTNFLSNNTVIAFIACIILFNLILGTIGGGHIFYSKCLSILIDGASWRFLVALGMFCCLIIKGVDLSAGRLIGLSACITGALLQSTDYEDKVFPKLGEIPIIVVFLLVIGIATFFGFINGVVISYLKVPPFIATLSMQVIIYGICLVFTGGNSIGGLSNKYLKTNSLIIGDIAIAGWRSIIALVLGFIIWFIYNKTKYGKNIYLISRNENTAKMGGINTKWYKIALYATAGLLYGVVGFLLVLRSGGAAVDTGQGYELTAIAGCAIGGVSVNGGKGKISGVFLGVIAYALLGIVIETQNIAPSYEYVVLGLVIIVAVAIDIRKNEAKK